MAVGGDVLANLPMSVLAAEGVPTFVAPHQVRGSARGAAAHVRWIRRLLRDVKPDIIHAHWLCGFACFAALAGAKPLVAMAWGSDVLRADRLKRAANRVALNRAVLAMADSQALIEAMVDLGGAARVRAADELGCRPRALPARPSASGTACAAELGLPEGRIVLSPRSLMPLYNPRTIVDAFELLADELPDIQLVLKHMGTDRPLVGPLRHPDRVHIVGHVPYERMVDWYQASDVCVSIASSDSSPRSVWEAVASGTPCVVSDLPWVHELIESRAATPSSSRSPPSRSRQRSARSSKTPPSPTTSPATVAGSSRRITTSRSSWTASPRATGASSGRSIGLRRRANLHRRPGA